MLFTPLLQRAQAGYGINSHGVGLAGKTEITVTSRLKASVKPELEVYGDQSTVNPLGENFLNEIAPGKKTDGSTTPTNPNGTAATLTAAIQALTPAQAGLLLAALRPTTTEKFTQIAPGISVEATPAVTPDGNSAALSITASFGVETNVKQSDNSKPLDFRPPDAVKNHTITTVATVQGFNLFPLSSFNVDTLYPRPPFVLPIIGQLPIIGNMFRFGRGVNRTYLQSVILVNATLIPRSLNLAAFYGANAGGTGALKNISLDANKKMIKQGGNFLLQQSIK